LTGNNGESYEIGLHIMFSSYRNSIEGLLFGDEKVSIKFEQRTALGEQNISAKGFTFNFRPLFVI
jgi:hypothetical protein